jgi:ABC-type branched-subunit amino acid transport system ATPase component/MFS family permease
LSTRDRLHALGGGAPLFPLALLFGLQLLDQATQSAFNVLIPNVRDAFHLSNAQILAIVAAAGACALVGTIPVAWMADRTRRVPIVLIGALLAATFSVALGLSPTAVVMAVMLCGVYLGQATIFPTHNSLIADYYPVSVRPRVYSTHRGALCIGAAAGTLIGAGLAAAFSWRVPFVVFAIPILILTKLGTRLEEPKRGRHEEEALLETGADTADVVGTFLVEPPPSFGEAWRMVWKIGVLRRIFFALPFLAAAIAGFASLASLQYQQTFHLDVLQRSFLVAPVQVFVLVGLVVGGTVGTRLARRGMHLVFRMLAVTTIVASGFAVLFALAPSTVVAFFADAGIEASLAVVGPGVLAALSLAIPPRTRSIGFSMGALFVLPGLLVLPLVGGVGDAVGFRYGMLMLVPVFVVGGLVVASAGSLIDADVRNVWLSMRTRREMLEERARGKLPLLSVKGLAVGYDGVPVLRDIDMEIAEGEIVALIGTNGAGKSTLLRAIGGITEADAGAIVFNGRDITHTPPDEIACMGVGLMPGGDGIFPTLTVEENLKAAAWQSRHDRAGAEERIARTLSGLELLAGRRHDRAGALSGGQQQLLALAMALLVTPSLLLIDELSLGLAPVVLEQLLDSLRDLRSAGTAVVLVEQSASLAISVADRVYIMDSGAIRFSGPASEVRRHPELLWSAYLKKAAKGVGVGPAGAEAATGAVESKDVPAAVEETPALEVSDASVRFGGISALDHVTFASRPGSVLGIIGPNGAGKTTLFDFVSGFTRGSGRVVMNGVEVTSVPATRRFRLGLGRSFQDSHLFSALSVRDTLAVALERYIDTSDPLNAAFRTPALVHTEEAVDSRVEELVELFGLQRFAYKFVSELSTGTRRLVDLAAVVAHSPKVVMLDEPSSGMAQREVEAMVELLLNLRRRLEATFVVVEHDIAFVSQLADRLLALDRGRVVVEGGPSDVLQHEEVMEAFLGEPRASVSRSLRTADTSSRLSSPTTATEGGW